jgi:putative NADH-flavin reductase
MKIAVIGASRGIGFEVVKFALLQGHAVRAYARRRGQLTLDTPMLGIFEGDVMDRATLDDVVEGADLVCCAIGVRWSRERVYTFSAGTKNILDAMRKGGAPRLICVTGIGAGDSKGHGGFFHERIMLKYFLNRIYEDKTRQEELVRGSGIDWTIVRPGFLTNGPMTVRYRALTDLRGVAAGRISRADVAHFIVSQADSHAYRHQAVLLTS